MAKDFKKSNPLQKLDKTEKESMAAVNNTDIQQAMPKKATQKGKVGRPKTKDVKNTCKNINVAVPKELLEQWEDVKIVHGSNLTAYIIKLIEKDMEENYDRYKDIADTLKNI